MRWILLIVLATSCGSDPATDPALPTPSADSPTGDTALVVVEESFVASAIPEHDILFVVDNSCSMSDNQAALSGSILPLVDRLNGAGMSWRIAVTSTDTSNGESCGRPHPDPPLNGKLRYSNGYRVIDSDTPAPEEVFADMVDLGTNGSGCEKGLGAAYKALERHKETFNADFVRESAALHIVVISDEQDQTEESPSPVVTLNEFKVWLNELRPVKQFTSFSSLVCLDVGPDCYSVGSRYVDVTRNIGGVLHSIDVQPFADPMAELGERIRTGGVTRYPLAATPAPDSVTVEIDHHATHDFTVVEDVVIFDMPTRIGAPIVIRYSPE